VVGFLIVFVSVQVVVYVLMGLVGQVVGLVTMEVIVEVPPGFVTTDVTVPPGAVTVVPFVTVTVSAGPAGMVTVEAFPVMVE